MPGEISGFYAVLDRDDPELAERLVAISGAGARVLQVRLKPAGTREIHAAAVMAREITRRHGALLVVNDRLDLAIAVGADGVHLGQGDLPLADARRLCERAGASLFIGVSTHDDDQVRAAVAAGADYLGFGPVYPTRTKQNPDPVQGIRGLTRAVAVAGAVPVVAIGGIGPDNVAAVARAGAAAACAIAAVNTAADVAAAGQAMAAPWRQPGAT
jgi:thiamine-phosphate pyrophosphorylase